MAVLELVWNICLLTIFTGSDARAPSRIVNGFRAASGEFPYIVSLRDNIDSEHFCGGAIISSKHILTAAHCADWWSPDFFHVASGITSQNDVKATISEIQKVVQHPDYVEKVPGQRVENDIAVITLKKPLDLDGYRQRAIKLPTKLRVAGAVGTIAGWGYVESLLTSGYSDNVPNDLSKLNLTILTREQCKERRLPPFEYQICATNPSATICQGDSGGPLVIDDTVIGVASTSSCLIGSTSAYMDVFYFKNFIEKSMRDI